MIKAKVIGPGLVTMPPSSIQECREMLELGRKLVVTAVEYQNSCLTRKEMVQIKTCLDSLVWKIAGGRSDTSLDSSKTGDILVVESSTRHARGSFGGYPEEDRRDRCGNKRPRGYGTNPNSRYRCYDAEDDKKSLNFKSLCDVEYVKGFEVEEEVSRKWRKSQDDEIEYIGERKNSLAA